MAQKKLNKLREAIREINKDLSLEVVQGYSEALQYVVHSNTLFSNEGWSGQDIVDTGKLSKSFRIKTHRIQSKYRMIASNTARAKDGYNYPLKVIRGYSNKRKGRNFYLKALLILKEKFGDRVN